MSDAAPFFISCLFVPVGSGLAYVGFFLGRAAAMRASDVLLLLGLGAHLAIGRCFLLFGPSSECDAIEDDIFYVVASEIVHSFWVMGLIGPIGLIGLIGPIGLISD